jgi:hypothetical protein
MAAEHAHMMDRVPGSSSTLRDDEVVGGGTRREGDRASLSLSSTLVLVIARAVNILK